MKKFKLVIFEAFFIILSLLVSKQSFAMKCVEGFQDEPFDISQVNQKHTSYTGDIRIIETEKDEMLVWQADYSATLTCYDDAVSNKNENVRIYLDNENGYFAKTLSSKNISAGVIYEGKEYYIGTDEYIITDKEGITKATSNAIGKKNCEFMGLKSSVCSSPNTITVQYSLFLKSRIGEDNLDGNVDFKVFQVDGVGGRNGGGNFSEWISLGHITYVDCVPQPTSQDVGLGVYNVNSEVGVSLGKVPFTINVVTSGKQCAGETFIAKLSANTIDNETIKTTNDDVGIQLFEAGKTNPLKLQGVSGENEILFAPAKGNSLISKELEASVIFTKKPETGEFNGILNYQLWIK